MVEQREHSLCEPISILTIHGNKTLPVTDLKKNYREKIQNLNKDMAGAESSGCDVRSEPITQKISR